MSKPKKKQTSKNTIRLQDALLQFHTKNYQAALKKLRNATLRDDEAEKAKKLEHILVLRLAFSEMAAFNFAGALKFLAPLVPADPLASGIAGISHLYNLDFGQSAPLLFRAGETYPVFGFYHLLALLYQKGPGDIEALARDHQRDWSNCSDAQKQYLHLIALCFAGDEMAAAEAVSEMKSESHVQHLNMEAIKNILTRQPIKSDSANERVKPLYRLLLNGQLSGFEKDYLGQFQEAVPELKPVLEKKPDLSPASQKEIEEQLNEKKVLTASALAEAMRGAPAELLPYIAFNQAVNALEQKYFEEAERGIALVADKYMADFVQVPESLHLYFQTLHDPLSRVNPVNFWRFVHRWLALRTGNLSVENLDAMGWQMFDILFAHSALTSSVYRGEVAKITGLFPSVFALKFAQILFPNMQIEPAKVADSRLDLLALPNAERNLTNFVEQFNKVLYTLSPYNGILQSMGGASLNKTRHAQQVEYFAKCFMAAVAQHPVAPQSRIALETFKLLNKQIKQVISNDGAGRFSAGLVEKFADSYFALVGQSDKLPDVGAFLSDSLSTKNIKYLKEFKQVVEFGSTADFTVFLKKHAEISDFTCFWEAFIEQIDDAHFTDALAEAVTHFLEAVALRQNDRAASTKEIDRFIAMYRDLCREISCEHPTTFFGLMVKFMVKKRGIHPELIHRFCAGFIEELTVRFKGEAKNYNAVADFLEFLVAADFQRSDQYDKNLVKKLKAYLMVTSKIKGTKKLLATIQKTKSLPT